MDLNELAKLLAAYKSGELETNEAVDRIKNLHFEDIGFARVDHSLGPEDFRTPPARIGRCSIASPSARACGGRNCGA